MAQVSGFREEQTRSEIIVATKRLVQKYGIRKVTMEDIASALGKKKSFLYYYYPSKREVLDAMVETELATLTQSLRVAVAQQQGAARKITTYITGRVRGVADIIPTFGSLVIPELLAGGDIGTDLASILGRRRAFDREEERFLSSLILLGIKEGAFRSLSPEVISDTTHFLLTALRGLELELIISRDVSAIPIRSLSSVLAAFMRGLAA